ncbi:MAG: class I SAM-dependent methyltransferase [Acidobacteriota bacterium]
MASESEAKAVHQYEHDAWSRCADHYLDGIGGLTRETLPLLVDAIGPGHGRRVLEVGSGPGHIAEALTQAGAVVTGVDFSASMIDVAKRRYPHISFQEADAEQLPFKADTFDAVVSNFVVHHLARPEIAFKEVCRVLKPGGRFVFIVFAAPEAQSSLGAFFRAVEEHHSLDELPHGPLFGVTDVSLYESLLRAAGLTHLEFDFRKVTWRTRTLDPVVESFWSWGDMGSLPQEVQDKVEAATRENLEAHRQEGEYAFPHEVLLGSATKP